MIKVIGHRGMSGKYPENTLLAIKKAIELGVHGVEFDVRSTQDNVIILFHDEKLDRLTGISGYVRSRTYEFISKLRVRGEKIPTLNEVLEFLEKQNVTIFVEIKEPDIVDKVLEILDNYKIKDRLYVISFYHNILPKVKSRDYRVGMIFVCRPSNFKKFIEDVEPNVILPRIDMIDEEVVNEAHNLGIEVVAWVVNDRDLLEKARSLNVDWVATDYPDKILKYVKESKITSYM